MGLKERVSTFFNRKRIENEALVRKAADDALSNLLRESFASRSQNILAIRQEAILAGTLLKTSAAPEDLTLKIDADTARGVARMEITRARLPDASKETLLQAKEDCAPILIALGLDTNLEKYSQIISHGTGNAGLTLCATIRIQPLLKTLDISEEHCGHVVRVAEEMEIARLKMPLAVPQARMITRRR